MENQIQTQKVNTNITGLILGENVTITYENILGENPTNVNATCNTGVSAGLPPMGTFNNLNMSINVSGQKNININSTKTVEDYTALISAIEEELKAILQIN